MISDAKETTLLPRRPHVYPDFLLETMVKRIIKARSKQSINKWVMLRWWGTFVLGRVVMGMISTENSLMVHCVQKWRSLWEVGPRSAALKFSSVHHFR